MQLQVHKLCNIVQKLFAQSMEKTSHKYANSNPKALHLHFFGDKDEDSWTPNLNLFIALYTKVEWS